MKTVKTTILSLKSLCVIFRDINIDSHIVKEILKYINKNTCTVHLRLKAIN